MADFIFMLTCNDRTVSNAVDYVDTVLASGITHMGFKDVGLPKNELGVLVERIHAAGAVAYLEVVSLDADSERNSVEAAVELGVDRLLGGTNPEMAIPIIEGHDIEYYPFPGRVEEHPSVLRGTLEEIVASAVDISSLPGVSGLDLLAYRWAGDVELLLRSVCNAVEKPVIVAGSIDSPERVRAVLNAGAAAFTIGTAALEGLFPVDRKDLSIQLASIVNSMKTEEHTRPACEHPGQGRPGRH